MKRLSCIVNPLAGISSEDLLLLEETAVPGSARLIHDGRNKLWEITWMSRPESAMERKFVVKKFNSSLKNRFIYSLCHSKARKSYLNALTLISLGIPSPMPCGYLERRNFFHILQETVYVSLYEDSVPLGDYLDAEGCNGLKEFAHFMVRVHKSGIRHDDLNRTNVRVKIGAGQRPAFSLIDLNRMKIYKNGKEVPVRESLQNLCRFSDYDQNFCFFIKSYLQERGLPRQLWETAAKIKLKHNRRVDAKKAFKNLFAPLKSRLKK